MGGYGYKEDEFFASDLASIDLLIDFLYELQSKEAFITTKRMEFLLEYYGEKELLKILMNPDENFSCKNRNEAKEWTEANKEFAIKI